jgi:hypothetical protein
MGTPAIPDLLAGFYDTYQAAGALRLSPVTLTKWRGTGRGPRWCRIDKRIFYREADLRSWIEEEASRSMPAQPDLFPQASADMNIQPST